MLSKNRRKTWSRKEKLKFVSESPGLEGQELGKYLRKNGLHSNQLSEWTEELMPEVVEKKKKLGRPRKDPKIAALEAENRELKRDLRRKNAALAEQTALIVLQKKVQELWGGTRKTGSLQRPICSYIVNKSG